MSLFVKLISGTVTSFRLHYEREGQTLYKDIHIVGLPDAPPP